MLKVDEGNAEREAAANEARKPRVRGGRQFARRFRFGGFLCLLRNITAEVSNRQVTAAKNEDDIAVGRKVGTQLFGGGECA